ncbi:MAG: T9SS type A sorting domain-containing protein [Bacteroidales bacterium]|nr:T9SS type A sorting domain-containing protein [Bacteroidales bacterium]
MKTKLIPKMAFLAFLYLQPIFPIVAQEVKSIESYRDFLLTISNVDQIAQNAFEFDLWLQDTDPLQVLELVSIQIRILYDINILNGNQTTAGMISVIPGSSGLPYHMQLNAFNTEVAGQIRIGTPPLGNSFIVPAIAPGVRICRLRFTNVVSFPMNSQPCLAFSPGTQSPYYNTCLYIEHDYAWTLPVIPGENAIVYENPVLNPDPDNPLPIIYPITGGGGYCGNVPGLPVGLSLSQQGVSYELFRDNTSTSQFIDGTGWPVSFDAQPAGTYTIAATNDSGTIVMESSAYIYELPEPGATITADLDTICYGSVVTITAITTDADNPVYQWYRNNFPVGDNSPVYSYIPEPNVLPVRLKVSTGEGCSAFSNTLAMFSIGTGIEISAIENAVDLWGIFSSVSGDPVTLRTLQYNAGINPVFEWFINGSAVENSDTCELTYIPGNADTVFVKMTVSPEMPCPLNRFVISDEVYIYTCTGPPTAFDVLSNEESCCMNNLLQFGITDSEVGVIYSPVPAYGNFVVGTGEALTFEVDSEGEYYVFGENACGSTPMTSTAVVSIYYWNLYIASNENNICSGSPVTFTVYPECLDTIPFLYKWTVVPHDYDIFTIICGNSFTYIPENGDLVYASFHSPCENILQSNDVFMMVNDCPGVQAIWTGISGSDWYEPGNWSSGIPQSDSHVKIPGDCMNYPTLTTSASCASIIVEDGGSFIGSEFLDEKSALVKCNIPDHEFHFLSSPMRYPNPSFGSVFPDDQQTVWARFYDEFSGDWINQEVDDLLIPGTGYSMFLTQPHTASFYGKLIQNNYPTIIKTSNPGSDPDRVGWNLLGNPHPCSLDWDLIPNAAAEQAVYVWNGVQYISWNGSVGALTDGIIPPLNGFFVKALVNTGQDIITIPLSARVHSNTPFYKELHANVLELRAEGNNYSDITYFHFNNEATEGFDTQFDARKLRGIEEAPQLFSYAGGKELSINEQPLVPDVVIELGFTCGESGNFILNGRGLESFSNKVRILLEDQKEEILQDLLMDNQYNFSYNAGESEHRFRLHFTEISSNPESALANIYSIGKTVIVNNIAGLNSEIQIFDFTGRMILNSLIDSGNQGSFTLNAASGPYVVKIITTKGVQSQKVVII